MAESRLAGAMKRLSTARARRRRASLGPPLQGLDDAALTALADVGAADLPMVEAFCRDAAGQRGVDLLRAGR